MPDNNEDPLSKLIINSEELDRKRLSEILDGYCAISQDGQIRPLPNFTQLDTASKILAVILAQKAANALGFSSIEQITPSSIEQISGLPGGTVRSRLMDLRQQRVVESIKGGYSIPNHSIINISLNLGEVIKRTIKTQKTRISGQRTPQVDSEELIKMLSVAQEQIGEGRLNLLLTPGKYLERALAVLAIARELGIDALTPSDITRFLKEKIRVNVIRENISLALGRGTKYVDRFPSSQSGVYSYRIMVAGDNLLRDSLIT